MTAPAQPGRDVWERCARERPSSRASSRFGRPRSSRTAEIDPREREQGQPDQHEHAEERVDLAGAGQQQRQPAQADADRVDQQHRLAMRQADVEQPVVEVAAVRRERRPALGEPPDDDPERVDDRHREDEQRDRDLGRAEDRQHGQRVAHEHHAARPDEDRRRVEVPAQEPEQRPGEGEAEHRDVRLADERQADQPERDRGDEHDARRQAVEPVDEVDAVDHPDDPEDRERRRRPARRGGSTPGPNGFDDELDRDPAARPRAAARPSCAGELPARPQVEVVVEDAERGRQRAADEQRDEARRCRSSPGRRRSRTGAVEPERTASDDGDERGRDRDAAAARDRDDG